MVVYSWQAAVAPKGLPAEVKAKLHTAMVSTLKEPEIAKKLTDPGFEVVANTPEEFQEFLQQEQTRWKNVIDVGNIKLE